MLQPNILVLRGILQLGAFHQRPSRGAEYFLRTAELLRAIDEATAAGSLDTKASLSMRGRHQFADEHIFGRSSRLCLKALDSHIASGSGDLSFDTCNALKTYRQIPNHGRPRVLGRPSSESLYLFTDAAYDEGRCGIGGILYGSNKEPIAFFSYTLNNCQARASGF